MYELHKIEKNFTRRDENGNFVGTCSLGVLSRHRTVEAAAKAIRKFTASRREGGQEYRPLWDWGFEVRREGRRQGSRFAGPPVLN